MNEQTVKKVDIYMIPSPVAGSAFPLTLPLDLFQALLFAWRTFLY
jgi:hypothetical protein